MHKCDPLTIYKDRKLSADRCWNWHYTQAINGKIDREAIVYSMNMCNVADKALICYEELKGD